MRRSYYFQEGGPAFGVGTQAHAVANPETAAPSAIAVQEKSEAAYEPLSSRGAQGWEQTKADFGSIGEIAAGFVPGLGEALDINNAVSSYKDGDYLGAGINAAAAGIGAVPVVGDIASLGLKAAAKSIPDILGGISKIGGRTSLVKDVALSAAPASPAFGKDKFEQEFLDSGPTFSDDQGGFGADGTTSFSEQVAKEKEVSIDAFGGSGNDEGGGYQASEEQVEAEKAVSLDAFGGSGDDSGGGGGGK